MLQSLSHLSGPLLDSLQQLHVSGQRGDQNWLRAHSLPSAAGWGENRKKARGLMDEQKVKQKTCTREKQKTKKRHFSLLPTGRQLSSHMLESKSSALTWEETINTNVPPSSPFLELLLLRTTLYKTE